MKRIDLRSIDDDIEIILPDGARLVFETTPRDTVTLSITQLRELFARFYYEQENHIGKRESTLAGYKQHFEQFYGWCASRKIDVVRDEHHP